MATILLMIAIFFVCSVTIHTIPRKAIEKNILHSMAILDNEGLKYQIGILPLSRPDNFTNALMLNIAYGSESKYPIESALNPNYYIIGNRKNIIKATQEMAAGKYNNIESISYGRYWHGYQTFLRPLLIITNIQGIRILNIICISTLFLILCYLIYTQISPMLCYLFIATSILFEWWVIPFSMQLSSTIYIALLASIFLLANQRKRSNIPHMGLFFLIIGCCTSYIDLLTTPLITLSLPLLIYLSVDKRTDKVRPLIGYSILWIIGYSAIWISKWILSFALTGYNIQDALGAAVFRTSTSFQDIDLTLVGIANLALSYFPILTIVGIIAVLSFIVFNIILCCKQKETFRTNGWLLLIVAMPFVWFLALRNHTIIHYWFVWRIFGIAVMAYLYFLGKMALNPKQKKHSLSV